MLLLAGADQWEVEEEDRAVRKSRLDRLLDQVLHNDICNVRATLMMMLLTTMLLMMLLLIIMLLMKIDVILSMFLQALKANCDVPLAKMVLALRFSFRFTFLVWTFFDNSFYKCFENSLTIF